MSSTWHYQILQYEDGDFGVNEVYCDEDKPISWTEDGVRFVADQDEGPDGCIKALEKALRDCRKYPVLRIALIPYEPEPENAK